MKSKVGHFSERGPNHELPLLSQTAAADLPTAAATATIAAAEDFSVNYSFWLKFMQESMCEAVIL